MNQKSQILNQINGGLVVSCQALDSEPLHSSFIMGRMAKAAVEGGAVGIRVNGPDDIAEIKKTTDVPIIGLWKQDYDNSEIYITPTLTEIDALAEAGVDIIATDATNRIRPGGITLDSFFKKVRAKYPDMLFMADCSTYEEGVKAEQLGFDIVSTTLAGYTKETAGRELPDFDMLKKLVDSLSIPVICEGGIWELAQLQKAFELGCHCAVIGSAITRPQLITKRFTDSIKEIKNENN
ncbi:N-acetylmannosamine-6-phosphate 2-epimerase [Pseudobutyrivibrio ruminis]|uniref:N-acetylmannosamine-6-phosphate 2-epimerase n=1 Tax=Pseudobutyrivibrio ruminis TaxID=46206 RepID=UPI00051C1CFD|nr:N-acetylmannosamine-6-phosphate 2-epimerase [Pseudobutyrivibrio ruminis]